MWGQPPSAVRRSEAPLLYARAGCRCRADIGMSFCFPGIWDFPDWQIVQAETQASFARPDSRWRLSHILKAFLGKTWGQKNLPIQVISDHTADEADAVGQKA